MQLSSARALKAELLTALERETNRDRSWHGRPFDMSAVDVTQVDSVQPSLALGIHPRGKGDYGLAVRVQRPELRSRVYLQNILSAAAGEVDVRYVGQIRPEGGPILDRRCRPILIGCSIGHVDVTAGTLGAFVASDGVPMVLSNNHVLANCDRGSIGDPVVQPGTGDGGTEAFDRIGALSDMVPLRKRMQNLVDCAVAKLDPSIDYDSTTIHTPGGIRKLRGVSHEQPIDLESVYKLGRSSGWTAGTVTAIEVDNVIVRYDFLGNVRFDGQLEIEGTSDQSFSEPGDSGALVMDDGCLGVGLVFAGSDSGGSNGQGLTWANPLQTVLDELHTELVVS